MKALRQPWWSRQWVLTAVGVGIAVLGGQAVHLWGVTWAIFAVALMFAFLLGWGAAYRYWRKRGYVPKI